MLCGLFIDLEVRKTKTEEPAPSINLLAYPFIPWQRTEGQDSACSSLLRLRDGKGRGMSHPPYQESSPTIGRSPLVKAEPSGSNHFLKVPPLCTLELGSMFIRYKLWERPLNHSMGSF